MSPRAPSRGRSPELDLSRVRRVQHVFLVVPTQRVKTRAVRVQNLGHAPSRVPRNGKKVVPERLLELTLARGAQKRRQIRRQSRQLSDRDNVKSAKDLMHPSLRGHLRRSMLRRDPMGATRRVLRSGASSRGSLRRSESRGPLAAGSLLETQNLIVERS